MVTGTTPNTDKSNHTAKKTSHSIVKVLDREEIPADMLLLASSEPGERIHP